MFLSALIGKSEDFSGRDSSGKVEMRRQENWCEKSGFLLLSAVDKYAIISTEVPVAQWIERRSPECAVVFTLTLLE